MIMPSADFFILHSKGLILIKINCMQQKAKCYGQTDNFQGLQKGITMKFGSLCLCNSNATSVSIFMQKMTEFLKISGKVCHRKQLLKERRKDNVKTVYPRQT